MHATIGDRLHIHSHTDGDADRSGQILEVRGKSGTPPYLVRFEDGHTSLVFPGPDATVEPSADLPLPAFPADVDRPRAPGA
jgi:hypothetical protein